MANGKEFFENLSGLIQKEFDELSSVEEEDIDSRSLRINLLRDADEGQALDVKVKRHPGAIDKDNEFELDIEYGESVLFNDKNEDRGKKKFRQWLDSVDTEDMQCDADISTDRNRELKSFEFHGRVTCKASKFVSDREIVKTLKDFKKDAREKIGKSGFSGWH